ncbi:hypothetical protein [Psychromonas hadalis]|nr:hypothetical protein [Psychromonas hadalis]
MSTSNQSITVTHGVGLLVSALLGSDVLLLHLLREVGHCWRG